MKTKKAIKELKATTDQLCKMYKDMYSDIQSQIEILFNERLAVKASIERLNSLVNAKNGKIDALSNKLGNLKSDIQTLAKHVQNLEQKEAEMEKEKCNCNAYQTPISIIDFILNPPFDTKPQTDYFLKAKNLLIEYAESTMIKKGMEYTPIGDRFANFRPILGEKKTAIEKLIGYNAKHVQYCFMQESNMTAKTIDELLEHWGDVFNYNVLGLAMQNTDKPNYYIVPYADRTTQEKEIKNIVDSVKDVNSYATKLSIEVVYQKLLNSISKINLSAIIYLFAKQLERLEGK